MPDQNNAPERIWVRVTDKTVMYAKPSDADEFDVEYIRADRAAPEGQVGALLEAEKRGMQKVLSHFRECAEHDQGGLDYSSLVGIPICNADELASEVAFYERAARHVQDVLDRAALASREAQQPAGEAMPVGCGKPCGYDCNGACFDPHACQQEAVTEKEMLRSMLADAERDMRQRAADACAGIEVDRWDKWKDGADMLDQGASDGAEECLKAILALPLKHADREARAALAQGQKEGE